MLTAVLGAAPANAFGRHDRLTTYGLSNSPRGVSFLRPAVLQAIIAQHDWMDAGYWDTFPSRQGRKGHDEKHFDDCGFDEGAQWIRDQYALMPKALLELRLINEVGREAYFPLGAATLFGRILHPAQDFYSHSNWVELGFPLGDDESTGRVEVTQSDLVDLSGAQSGQSSLVQQWYAPNYWGAVVRHDRLRGDILLDYDDADFIPGYLAISTRAFTNSPYVPVVYDYVVGPGWPNIKGRLLISAHSPGENECNVRMIRQSGRVDEYDGPSHNSLNKDGPKSSPYDPNDPSYQVQLEKYRKAYALAALQTGYEWCRLVHEAHVADRDGVLLAMWVRAGSNPHPAETPCRPHPPGPKPITVTIDSIQVLDSGDGRLERGEIQLAAVLYDDPENFHRSVHVTNRTGRMSLFGEFVPIDQLPAPMTISVGCNQGATFTLHAWDNAQALGEKYSLDFDSGDDLLAGFRQEFGSTLPTGPLVREAADLRVTFRVTQTKVVTDRGPLGQYKPAPSLCDAGSLAKR